MWGQCGDSDVGTMMLGQCEDNDVGTMWGLGRGDYVGTMTLGL